MTETFEETVACVDAQWSRTVVGIEVDGETATTIRYTLGCGHTVNVVIASHPVRVLSTFGIDLGYELECDRCLR